MLSVFLFVMALAWAMWFTYMLRYPKRWAVRVDTIHSHLTRYGLSVEWMKQLEKGIFLKTLVAACVVVLLACVIENLRHPDALSALYHAYYAGAHWDRED